MHCSLGFLEPVYFELKEAEDFVHIINAGSHFVCTSVKTDPLRGIQGRLIWIVEALFEAYYSDLFFAFIKVVDL